MATKVKKEKVEKKAEIKEKKEPYFYAVGRRKSATAQAKLFAQDKAGDEDILINGKKLIDYFPTKIYQDIILAPFQTTGTSGKFMAKIDVRGGGPRGQVEAVRLSVARAIVKYDEALKTSLRAAGYLTRDSRKVERKKAGLKKARRAPQWQKR
jgi:small subunit ribosomal protein S9